MTEPYVYFNGLLLNGNQANSSVSSYVYSTMETPDVPIEEFFLQKNTDDEYIVNFTDATDNVQIVFAKPNVWKNGIGGDAQPNVLSDYNGQVIPRS